MKKTKLWKEIKDYPNYKVSEDGEVISFHHNPPIILKAQKNNVGYFRVGLVENRKSTKIFIHKIVAEAFIGTRPENMEINHINGIKTDNRAENLEYLTRNENLKHAYKTGLMKQNSETLSDLTAEKVKEIRTRYKDGEKQSSLRREFNLSRQSISDICTYQRWKTVS